MRSKKGSLLETFKLAAELSKEIDRYVAGCAGPAAPINNESTPDTMPIAGKWPPQDDWSGMM